MRVILEIILLILELYFWVVLATVIFSWLISFNVINTRNQFVEMVWRALTALTEPLLRPIRRFMPDLGGLDISPIILFIGIYALERVIVLYVYPNVLF